MSLALRETFGYKRSLGERLITFPLYLFLVLWPIGFGYGFWYNLMPWLRAPMQRQYGRMRGAIRHSILTTLGSEPVTGGMIEARQR